MIKKIKIAIADDHEMIRQAVKTVLINWEFEVIIEGKDGNDLIHQIESSDSLPDLCILDVSMPNLDGFSTTKVIKSKWQFIKIIGFSVDEKNKVKMLKNGADCFLLKDCPKEMLYETIINLTNTNNCSGQV
jgi:DNA-binding NarL/FixJ family response regulator